jgi:hypothetical protein
MLRAPLGRLRACTGLRHLPVYSRSSPPRAVSTQPNRRAFASGRPIGAAIVAATSVSGEQYRRALRMTPNEIASYSMPACANHHPTFAKYAHLAAGQRHKALGGEKRRILVSNNQTELLPAVQRTHFDVYQPARGC